MKRICIILLFLVAGTIAAFSQQQVRGTVTDNKDTPLEGVSVTIKGANNGVTTNTDGTFVITTSSSGKTILNFSFTGYKTVEVTTDGLTPLAVKLELGDNRLNDVVVVGYGTQRQKDLTGAVATVSSKDFNKGQVLSPQQSIQGKITGVNISQNSGKPGGSNTIRIRGGTSLTGSNDPLYVIDGVPISNTAGVSQANIGSYGTDIFDQEPTNPLMTLSPDDIESITVLKDASATAIYGSRGANGVIVITTKKGTAGTARVSLDASAGASKVEGTLVVLTADQYRQAQKTSGLTIDDKGANTDWQDEIFRAAYSQDYNLSISGGSNKTTYRASLGYGNQQSIMIGSDFKRANARINVNHSALNDRLTFDLRLNYGQTVQTRHPFPTL